MIRHTRTAGPGSRERTREIGRAEAFGAMADMLQGQAGMWRKAERYAAETGNMHAAHLLGFVAERVRDYAEYAGALWGLHADDRPPLDPYSALCAEWDDSPAPHETGSFPAVSGGQP